ncbi:hypothetical protein NDU88_001471 [Pleurodeles waltl]|uniref:Uncharacterized protein n=1 Tax=Pleurodeles waltl TaxID=8319 RepID=A0AAV7V7X8_PLEWA|nr:hypothetical protein NDU88_001471 [Pleurodeles waltl]
MCRLVSTQGWLCVDFQHSVVDPLRVEGLSDARDGAWISCVGRMKSQELRQCGGPLRQSSGPCVEYPITTLALRPSTHCKVKLHRSGVASISPAESGGVVLARPCVKVLISRQALRRFLLRSRAALSLQGRASKFRSSRRRRVDQRRCAAFFLPQNKLCVEKFGARSVQEEE